MDKKILEYTNTGDRSPGPANYCVKPTIGKGATDPTIEKNPEYSMMGRRASNKCRIGPGPVYDTTKMNQHGRDRAPGGLLSSRFAKRGADCLPGPAEYTLPSTLSRRGPVIRAHVGPTVDRFKGPSPNAYTLPDTLNRRAARLTGRHADRDKCATPGPGHYDATNTDRYLPETFGNGRTIGARLQKGKRANACTPGPACYNGDARVNCCATRGNNRPCRTTFGIRWPDTVPTFAVPQDNQFDDC